MKDSWAKAFVYGRGFRGLVAHIVDGYMTWGGIQALCMMDVDEWNTRSNPYPVCKNCLRTKRAKELGL